MSAVTLIQPVEVVRDSVGDWWHPDLPDWPGDEFIPQDAWEEWLHDQQLEATLIDFESDAPQELQDRYFENGQPEALAEWQPSMPEGHGWFMLFCIGTEDGAVCYWARRTAEVAG